MYTQCPHCATRYRISAEQLRAASGRVRCTQCERAFDALTRLTDAPPPPEDSDGSVADASRTNGAAAEGPDPVVLPPEPGLGDDERRQPGKPRRRGLWAALSVLALITLGAQLSHWKWSDWAQNPDIRPYLVRACDWIPQTIARLGQTYSWLPDIASNECWIPPYRALDELALINSEFTSHPRVDGALYFSGVLVNRAELGQPYPLLSISMTDPKGDTVAMGHFGPADYLAEPVSPDGTIGAGKRVPVRLELRDPGDRASGFRFDFRARR